MNDQCLNCRIRKSCYYKEPEEDWTCEHYGYFNGLLGEIDRLEVRKKEVNNEKIREQLNDAEKVIGESLKILNDIKFAMKRDVKKEVDEAYQRGVEDGRNETWEAARKIAQQWEEETDTEHRVVIDDSIRITLDSMTASEAIAKLKACEEKQKADEDVKRGDVVIRICDDEKYLVTYVDDRRVCGINGDGKWCGSDLKSRTNG